MYHVGLDGFVWFVGIVEDRTNDPLKIGRCKVRILGHHELNKEELAEKTARLKNRIENFGEINPMAVEAFNEMKVRADFITNQKNDLNSAKEMLLKTIEEIDMTKTMRDTKSKTLLTAFKKMQNTKQISRVFLNQFIKQVA